MICQKCGFNAPDSSRFCLQCGAPFQNSAPSAAAQPGPTAPSGQHAQNPNYGTPPFVPPASRTYSPPQTPVPRPSSAGAGQEWMPVTALVAGILSVLTSPVNFTVNYTSYPLAGLMLTALLSGTAGVLGCLSLRHRLRGVAIAALCCAGAGILLRLLVYFNSLFYYYY